MAIIKKFRIKSFKNQKPVLTLKKISLSFGKRQILDNISFKVNSGQKKYANKGTEIRVIIVAAAT